MRFENQKTRRNTNFEVIKSSIPMSIRKKIEEYKPTDDLLEVEYIEFSTPLSNAEKTTLLNMFPELREV